MGVQTTRGQGARVEMALFSLSQISPSSEPFLRENAERPGAILFFRGRTLLRKARVIVTDVVNTPVSTFPGWFCVCGLGVTLQAVSPAGFSPLPSRLSAATASLLPHPPDLPSPCPVGCRATPTSCVRWDTLQKPHVPMARMLHNAVTAPRL